MTTKKPNPDAPLTDAEWKKLGSPMHGLDGLPAEARAAVQRSRGRPRAENPKINKTVRFAPEALEILEVDKPGWQVRLHQAIAEYGEHHGKL